jgi:hypothetical protein
MTKKTRRQKVNPKHPFLISWEGSENKALKSSVKGQLKDVDITKLKKVKPIKKANYMDKGFGLDQIKHDIIKSLILASLILGLEMVIYLAWNV